MDLNYLKPRVCNTAALTTPEYLLFSRDLQNWPVLQGDIFTFLGSSLFAAAAAGVKEPGHQRINRPCVHNLAY